MDLAEGHVAALKYMDAAETASGVGEYSVFNLGNLIDSPQWFSTKCRLFVLGTGKGYSVLDMVAAMEKASGRPIPYEIGPRREGDIATCYADTAKASNVLKWVAKKDLNDMCTGNAIHIQNRLCCCLTLWMIFKPRSMVLAIQ